MSKKIKFKQARKGRTRKEGPRYANGRLKPEPVNNRIVMKRRGEICKDITKASCPLDAALANEWISPADHRAATMFESLARQIGASGPAVPTAMDLSTPSSAVDARGVQFRDMQSSELVKVWDSAMSRTGGPPSDEDSARVMVLWKRLNAAMSPAARRELYAVTVGQDWPQWINQRVAVRSIERRIKAEKREATHEEAVKLQRAKDKRWDERYDLLVQACGQIRAALRVDTISSAPMREGEITAVPGPKVRETTVYVDPTGAQVLEVVRVRRKASAVQG
jgi:hypothetical protein